jgi:hypothetical protein
VYEQDGGAAAEEGETGGIQPAVPANVNRGVFKPIPSGEANRYKGAINYISMVEAFKTSPFATTPLSA